MTKKRLLPLLLLSGLLTLSACSLFDDEDIKIHNEYNPQPITPAEDPNAVKACGVTGKTVSQVGDALCFKSIGYGVDGFVPNTYKVGGVNENEFKVNGGEDYPSTRTSNNYDLYVPNSAKKDDKHLVILFIHGGAWVSGFKSDVNEYVWEFANRGYITATIKYSLLKRTMDDPTTSIFRNLDEIDACITSIKQALTDLGFDTTKTKLVIGGASSGAHLSMLYSYSRGANAALPIQFIVDAVGPVDIKPATWKAFTHPTDEVLDAGITKDAIQTQMDASNIRELKVAGDDFNWNDYQTMRIANGMCGLPYPLSQVEASTNEEKVAITDPNEASNAMTNPGGGEDQLSVTYWLNKVGAPTYKIVCAYAGKDSVVGINQYATLQKALEDKGIEKQFTYFKNSNHTEITKEKDETAYDEFIHNINTWCEAI